MTCKTETLGQSERVETHLKLQLKPALNLVQPRHLQDGNGGTVRTSGNTSKTATQTRSQSLLDGSIRPVRTGGGATKSNSNRPIWHVTCKTETVGQSERVEAHLKPQLEPALNLLATSPAGRKQSVSQNGR